MKRSEIDDQNRYLLKQQHDFRKAADIVTDALIPFDEIQAIAVIGSIAKPLWKEIPRFSAFRRAGIEVWHECKDLDLAVWITSMNRLDAIRRAKDRALRHGFETGTGPGVANHQVEVFLIDPATDRHLGRLCHYNACPKGHRDCVVLGCGAVPFNKIVDGFVPHADLLAAAPYSTVYRKGVGRLRSALDLPPTIESPPPPRRNSPPRRNRLDA
jgi:hypothetical protein